MHNDFSGFWSGARTLVDGESPFDAAAFAQTFARYGTQQPDTAVFGYPAWTAIALVPLALLPVPIASSIWTVGTITLGIIAVRALLGRLSPRRPVVHGLVGLSLLTAQAARVTVLLGQWGFLLLAATAATVVWLLSGHPRRAGVTTVIFLAKPHLFVGAIFGLAVSAFARGVARRYVGTAVVAVALVVAASAILIPGWWNAWLSAVPARRLFDPPQTTTLATVLYGLWGREGTRLALVILAAGAIATAGFHPRSEGWLALWLCLSPAIAVYAWSYDQILLIIPMVMTGAIAGRHSERRAVIVVGLWTVLLSVFSTFLAVIAAQRAQESYTAIVPLLGFLLTLVVAWPERALFNRSTRADALPPNSVGG